MRVRPSRAGSGGGDSQRTWQPRSAFRRVGATSPSGRGFGPRTGFAGLRPASPPFRERPGSRLLCLLRHLLVRLPLWLLLLRLLSRPISLLTCHTGWQSPDPAVPQPLRWRIRMTVSARLFWRVNGTSNSHASEACFGPGVGRQFRAIDRASEHRAAPSKIQKLGSRASVFGRS